MSSHSCLRWNPQNKVFIYIRVSFCFPDETLMDMDPSKKEFCFCQLNTTFQVLLISYYFFPDFSIFQTLLVSSPILRIFLISPSFSLFPLLACLSHPVSKCWSVSRPNSHFYLNHVCLGGFMHILMTPPFIALPDPQSSRLK